MNDWVTKDNDDDKSNKLDIVVVAFNRAKQYEKGQTFFEFTEDSKQKSLA